MRKHFLGIYYRDIAREHSYLKEDIKKWRIKSFKTLFYTCTEQSFWATVFYRFRRMMRFIKTPLISIVFRIINFLLFKFTEFFLGVTIRSETEIGPGLYIGHAGIIRIHPKVKAGKNLSIGQLVTIGELGPGHGDKVPTIGDNVYIGVGAKVLGEIKIGNNVKIGANAVVVKDVPDNATVVGVPAKVVKIKEVKRL